MSAAPRVCLVSASDQNVFMAEILAAFGSALSEHAISVEESTDRFPATADDLVYLFVPHEYHPFVGESAHPSAAQLRRSVAICTEQPGTHWFDVASAGAAQAGAVVDINRLGAEEMSRRGIDATYVPLGYVPAWDHWRRRERPRSIEIAYLGGDTGRRAGVLESCAPVLERRSSAVHVVSNAERHLADSPHFLSGERKWELMADAETILNVHRDDLPYLEWHRVIGAILNGCVVVSEPSIGTEPLVPGEHFVAADLDDLPRVLDELLDDPARLERIRNAAYDLVRQEMPASATAAGLLTAIERVTSNRSPASRRWLPGRARR